VNLPGNYEIKDKLGEGGFAAVYRAQHKTLGTDFAVKGTKNC